MNEQQHIKQFSEGIEHLVTKGELPPTEFTQHTASLFAIAQLLIETDLSYQSRQSETIRQHLVNTASNLEETTTIERYSPSQRANSPKHIEAGLRMIVVSAAAIIITLVAVFAIPPFRVFALQIINFFSPVATDETITELQISVPDISPDYDPHPYALEQLTEQVGFELKVPAFMPQSYTFDGASYDAENQWAFMSYRCAETWAIGIYQQATIVDDLPTSEVGAPAVVEQTLIGTATGQYVRGTWIEDFDPDDVLQAQEVESAIDVTAERVWTNDTQWQRLTWYENGVRYSVLTSEGFTDNLHNIPECLLEKDDFIAIAHGLQYQ